MSHIGERVIQIDNGEACPQCLRVYPAPTDGAASVTCGGCGFVNQLTAKLCGRVLRAGDYVRVRYTTGREMKDGVLRGVITRLWPFQAQVNGHWCFHNHDEILEYRQGGG